MGEQAKTYELLKRTKILNRSAFVCYMIPFLFLGIFIFDHFIVHFTQELFWSMFLISMFPFGLLGLLFSIIGIIQSGKISTYKRKTANYYTLFMGLVVIAAGILAWMLLYLVNR